jgi:hypothetical protein
MFQAMIVSFPILDSSNVAINLTFEKGMEH